MRAARTFGARARQFIDEGLGDGELVVLAVVYLAGAAFWWLWKFTDLLWWIR